MSGHQGTRRGAVLAAVLLCLTLPGFVALVEGVAFYAANRGSGVIMVGEERRGYLLHVPRGHDQSRPTPLVISLHGGALWGAAQRDISGWNALADHEGFIVAYPSGAGRASPRVWGARLGPDQQRDVEFLTQLIDTLIARHNVDPSRVYVNGLSNGGGMTFTLSCAAADRVAAAGIVGGALFEPWGACIGAPPIPVVVFHGTDDSTAPYEGGTTWVAPWPFPNIPHWVGRWAERNRCEVIPRDSALSATVTRRAYSSCAGGADVVLYTLHGDGHVWPGGGALPRWLVGTDSRSLDATRVMWEFFVER
ncbi:MAG TPA: PHB depolymerase family esterase [Longimicrobiales bacterium]|nr:PHB depolymerase family esterase [Longimicrobiales bacterium]